MRLRWPRRRSAADDAERPLSWWVVVVYAVTAVGIGAGVVWWTWPSPPLDSAAEQIKAETQAVRTGLAAAGGAGAAFTLLLAVRRQRATEAMNHATEAMNRATQHDAAEQRVTALYTTAVEQLGHEHAAVRLGGLYSLQRLGHDHPGQRRAIVNVWCAYLRMPFTHPDTDDEELDEAPRAVRRQELQVRTTVQDLLREHAHPNLEIGTDDPRYWGEDLTVDLTGATLHHLDWSRLRIHPHTHLTHTHFTGTARLNGATFPGTARFDGATFTGDGWFGGATFTGDARFSKATFTGDAGFSRATFIGDAKFFEATFTGAAGFNRATFTAPAMFVRVTFTGDARFSKATFTGPAWFREATFTGGAWFSEVKARADEEHVWPPKWRLASVEHPDVDTDEQGRLLLSLQQDPLPEASEDPDDDSPAPS